MMTQTNKGNSEMSNQEITVKISGRNRKFTIVKTHDTPEGRALDIRLANGWDGRAYYVKGARGAMHMCYRNATTGEYKVII
jgi:hypothetical protein